ncbi:MAG: hypothetical protein MR999_02180 [Flintibacter sp.]|uniref:hypothetical protein n=1 Tax=Flintibacter sp. TaxID=1918624 RepID=UPI002D7F6429|nr:hypothetical protein [Flintibacter sp.]MCI7158222.1 hypothetical protein [Flintibacter sp.]
MEKKKSAVRSLLDIEVGAPEAARVKVVRLGLILTVRELPYDRLNKLRGLEDSDLQYLMESTVEPKFRDKAWYKEKMGCPTPIEAMKKLLREGEVRAILRKCDELNGYGYGAVVPLSPDDESIPEDELQGRAIGAALEDLEKN